MLHVREEGLRISGGQLSSVVAPIVPGLVVTMLMVGFQLTFSLQIGKEEGWATLDQ